MTASATAGMAETQDRFALRALGFWLYLMSDSIVFALLFATYILMVTSIAGGPAGNELFSLPNAFAETMLLLLSSTTFGFATVSMNIGARRRALVWLLASCLLGLGFLVLELRELHGLVHRGAGPDRSGFLSAFFTLVGTHGLHVGAGVIWILVMMRQIVIKGLTGPVCSRLFRLGLFWHFLDIVWIGIFSIVYLPGVL
ncbi:MAG: cytochrome o ubiquinol oxidase subunit III [Hyphomicrobiales bacterium]|nr:cytochrome o ubiquinol oxidase subunit III [Hyphomicrobiales bacterium]